MARLTPEAERLILAAIRAGAPALDAVQAAGITRGAFHAWMKRRSVRRRFRREVHTAAAQARARAAIDVREQDVKFWLRHGPAKRAWVSGSRSTKTDQQLTKAEALGLMGSFTDALQPFPEAHQAILGIVEREENAK
jgi:hypothetical protein